jgi:hypothetical protein
MISIYLYLYTNNSLDNAIIYIRVWLASRAEPVSPAREMGEPSRAELGQPPSRAKLGSFPALGRSTAQWRVPAAAKPPVRFPAMIGEAKWCPVIVSVWRSFGHSVIEQRKAREGEGSSPEQGRGHGGACLNDSGRREVGMAGVVWRRRGSSGSFYRRSGKGGGWGRRRAPASSPWVREWC